MSHRQTGEAADRTCDPRVKQSKQMHTHTDLIDNMFNAIKSTTAEMAVLLNGGRQYIKRVAYQHAVYFLITLHTLRHNLYL